MKTNARFLLAASDGEAPSLHPPDSAAECLKELRHVFMKPEFDSMRGVLRHIWRILAGAAFLPPPPPATVATAATDDADAAKARQRAGSVMATLVGHEATATSPSAAPDAVAATGVLSEVAAYPGEPFFSRVAELSLHARLLREFVYVTSQALLQQL